MGDRDLGDDVLEVGAGPGLTTDVMRLRVPKLTAIEIDHALAEKLRKRLEGTNVTVVEADATQLPLEDQRFSTATNFTSDLIIGTDVVPSDTLDEFHEGDVYVTCDPEEMPDRLKAAGFVDVRVERADVDDPEMGWVRSSFRFVGTKP